MGVDPDQLRAEARRVLMTGLAAAEAGPATLRALAQTPLQPLAEGGRRVVIALGRSACAMAGAVLATLSGTEPDRPRPEAIVVTMAGAARPVAGAWVLTAGWPDPDIAGMRAAAAVEGAVAPLAEGDSLVLLLSEGAEVLVPAPVSQLPLSAMVELDRKLRKAGAGAAEAMLVRQQLSRIEGGGLLSLAQPATVEVLAIATGTAGEEPRRIAGGMAARPIGSTVTARALVELYGLWRNAHKMVRQRLSAAPVAPSWSPRPRFRVVGATPVSVAAMLATGHRLGACRRLLGGGAAELVHDILAATAGVAPGAGLAFAIETGTDWVAAAGDASEAEEADDGGGVAVLTLTAPLVAGAPGPRLADQALRFLCLARDRRFDGPWVLALSGTGCAQGACGWIVDSDTLVRARALGLDPDFALASARAVDLLAATATVVKAVPDTARVGDIGLFLRG